MYVCYLLSVVTLGMLILLFAQDFGHFLIGNANEVTFGILTSIIYLFTETLIIFFFVGTGVSVKEYTHDHHLSNEFHRKSIPI